MSKPESPHEPARVPLLSGSEALPDIVSTARRNLLAILPEAAFRDTVVSGRSGKRWHLVMEPGAVRRVLLENSANYPKSEGTKAFMHPVTGESIFVADGPQWRWQRRAMAPAFSPRNIAALAPVMSRAAEHCRTRIAASAPGPADLAEEMVRTTFDVIAEVALSDAAAMETDRVRRAFDTYVTEAGPLLLSDFLGRRGSGPGAGSGRLLETVRAMKSVTEDAIEAWKTGRGTGTPNLMERLVSGTDPETGRGMTSRELRGNLLTMIIAGHETTALALAWALYLCAFDQSVQERARAEAQAVLADATATGDDMAQLPFIRMVIDEAMRLYPPGALISRTALGPDTLCGTAIRKGETIVIPVYAVHRHRMHWEDPDTFRPARFAQPDTIARHAYMPFGDGPRVCIGASFALQEMVIILSTLLARFRFTPVPGRTPTPVSQFTLRPEGGVWLRVEALGTGSAHACDP